MGSDKHYPEEAPSHRVTVSGFWMDRTPVTNRDFRKFVNATGYVTFAETRPDARDYPGALPHMLKAGSLVFTPPKHPVDLRNWSQWWRFKFGANGDKGSLAFYNWFAYEFWRFVNVQQEVASSPRPRSTSRRCKRARASI